MIPNPDIQILCTSLGPVEAIEMRDGLGVSWLFRYSVQDQVIVELTDFSGWRYEPMDVFHLSDKRAIRIHSVSWEMGHWELSGVLM